MALQNIVRIENGNVIGGGYENSSSDTEDIKTAIIWQNPKGGSNYTGDVKEAFTFPESKTIADVLLLSIEYALHTGLPNWKCPLQFLTPDSTKILYSVASVEENSYLSNYRRKVTIEDDGITFSQAAVTKDNTATVLNNSVMIPTLVRAYFK